MYVQMKNKISQWAPILRGPRRKSGRKTRRTDVESIEMAEF
jgi:hypothetical protein